MDLTQIANKYVLGLLPADGLWKVAVEALEAGFDSPALRKLAGADGEDQELTKKLIHIALSELGVHMPTSDEAGLALAQEIARCIIQGKLQPYEGALHIRQEVYSRCPQLSNIDGIISYIDEYEDDEKHREGYAQLILDECHKLVAHQNGQRGV